MYITLSGNISSVYGGDRDIDLTVILNNTCQVSYNSAVKGITLIEQTGIVGYSVSASDPRLTITSVKKLIDKYEIIVISNKATVTGVLGDDKDRFIFIYSQADSSFIATKITSVSFNLGILRIIVPATVALETLPFYIPMVFTTSLDKLSYMTIQGTYTPYQGEGIQNREYSILNAETAAFISSNGTGAAPVIGLKDVYPYNRELPLVTCLPSLVSWSDSDLTNQSLSGDISSNYEVKQASNVEHTIPVILYTNDFIEPVTGFKRKKLRLLSRSGSRGFSKTAPNVGFGIKQPKVKSVLGDSLQATVASVTVYVDNK
jgi:hypothetical protein